MADDDDKNIAENLQSIISKVLLITTKHKELSNLSVPNHHLPFVMMMMICDISDISYFASD